MGAREDLENAAWSTLTIGYTRLLICPRCRAVVMLADKAPHIDYHLNLDRALDAALTTYVQPPLLGGLHDPHRP